MSIGTTKQTSAHTCHAVACYKEVPRKMFMCKVHWFMVSMALRKRIWDAFDEKQLTGEITPSKEWLVAAHLACEEVAKKEGIKYRSTYLEILRDKGEEVA